MNEFSIIGQSVFLLAIGCFAITYAFVSRIKEDEINKNEDSNKGRKPYIHILLYVASQTIVMIMLFIFRENGKSLSNAGLQMLYVIAIIAVGTIVCLSLHQSRSKISGWALLYVIASTLNLLLWELTPALQE